jgi:hypothetical protein
MALQRLEFNVDDVKTLRFQLREADKVTPVDITGLTFRFYAKAEPGDAAYTISPVTATIPLGTDGRFQFDDVTMPSTPSDSKYWIEREDGGGKVDTFKPAEGTDIAIKLK